MRFLVDENLSPDLAIALTAQGHDAVTVRSLGLQRAGDPEVLERAAAERRVLLSADTDFGALLARSGAKRPSVILLRSPVDRRARSTSMLLEINLPYVEDALSDGAVVVFEATRIRIRRLPLP